MREEPGVRFAIGQVGIVAAVLVVDALRLDRTTAFELLLVATALLSLGLGPAWRAGLAVSGWAMFTGFAEHGLGTLTFAGGDLLRLAVLVGGSVVLTGVITHQLRRQQARA